jgi:hypothetical protein
MGHFLAINNQPNNRTPQNHMKPQTKQIEGPIQYDAAIDPTVAAVKIKSASAVAGRANVFVFPDLNTGNNTYKAVQQATGAIAMGPVMQVCARARRGRFVCARVWTRGVDWLQTPVSPPD